MSRICVIIPTFNNGRYLSGVLDSVLQYSSDVIVVNDGSTDGTDAILQACSPQVRVLMYTPNRGKGYALNVGFTAALAAGYDYAVTMDSDGQHSAADLPAFFEAVGRMPQTMLIGSRRLRQENMPEMNTFANRFSNFWFTVQTGRRLPDTQTGFRLYPLQKMRGMRSLTSRYEAELEWLVRLAWRGVRQIPIPISVYYPPQGDRITHFRPAKDFLRISLLNTAFCFLAIVYGYPAMLFRWLTRKINVGGNNPKKNQIP
ncbi:MAG: glycosyltransferase family 2 protein [Bacteroidales bacterium]|jgi:glycosyltransferase involved in cell wall biosynthesis|nr:glycosyltransferase family 2 protein [Bacteroidales bacterium]